MTANIPTKIIPLTRGRHTVVDASDYEWLARWSWHTRICGKQIYAVTSVIRNGVVYAVGIHRIILDAPEGMMVDHIDGNGLNNTRANLRLATSQQNQWNRGKYSNNTSGYKGVSWDKSRDKWTAHIRVNGRLAYLGAFTDKEAAARAYREAAPRLHGEFAHV